MKLEDSLNNATSPYINTNKTLTITTPPYTLTPNSQNIQLPTGSGTTYLELTAPNTVPTAYWAIRNTNNCGWLNWNTNPNSNGPINAGQTVQISATVSSNSQGTFSCPAELRIGISSTDLYCPTASCWYQDFHFTFTRTNP